MPLPSKPNPLLIAAALSLTLVQPAPAQTASPERLEEVTRHGMHVMPFDLKQTRHIFAKTETGGIQQVIIREQGNAEQIELIRRHLKKISQEFSRGDPIRPKFTARTCPA